MTGNYLENYLSENIGETLGDPLLVAALLMGIFAVFLTVQRSSFDGKIVIMIPVFILAAVIVPDLLILAALVVGVILYLALRRVTE